jgi:hypothetical protein
MVSRSLVTMAWHITRMGMEEKASKYGERLRIY